MFDLVLAYPFKHHFIIFYKVKLGEERRQTKNGSTAQRMSIINAIISAWAKIAEVENCRSIHIKARKGGLMCRTEADLEQIVLKSKRVPTDKYVNSFYHEFILRKKSIFQEPLLNEEDEQIELEQKNVDKIFQKSNRLY